MTPLFILTFLFPLIAFIVIIILIIYFCCCIAFLKAKRQVFDKNCTFFPKMIAKRSPTNGNIIPIIV